MIAAGLRLGFFGLLSLAFANAQLWPYRIYAHGDLHERISKISAGLEKKPRDATLYRQRAGLHRQHREWSKALADLAEAHKLAPEHTDRYEQAIVLLESGEALRAKELLHQYLADHPKAAGAMVARARAYVALKDDSSAAVDFAEAIHSTTKADADLYLEYARCLVRLNRRTEAIAALDAASERLGDLAALQKMAVDLEIEATDYDAALKRILRMESGSAMRFDLMQLRGEILLKAERSAEARETFEMALASLENPAVRMNPRLQAIRTTLQSHLQELYAKI